MNIMLYVFLGFIIVVSSIVIITILNAKYKKSTKRVTKRNSK